MLKGIKTVVFDLDGTVYQNNSFHGDYIRFLLDGTGKENWEQELTDYVSRVYRGEHLEMNSFYSALPVEAASAGEFFRALEGRRLELSYEQAFEQAESAIYLGDAWAIVSLLGKSLGLLSGGRENAVYKRTREKMSRDGMSGSSRLRDAIIRLGQHYNTVLLTNSYEATALDFLRQLGFDGVFKDAVYSANKPYGMADNLARHCPELYSEPESFLTIGDHAFNDLMPLQRLGCRALWINPFEGIHEPAYDLTVHTLDELACCLEKMCI